MTALPDVNGNTTLTPLLPTSALTVTGTGASIDVRQLSGVGAVVMDAAAGTGTTPTCAMVIQDSPDGTTGWAPIAGAAFVGLTTVASQQKIGVNWNACRGFVRAAYTIGGTTPSYTLSVNAVSRMEL
jgi:hypothetical protein